MGRRSHHGAAHSQPGDLPDGHSPVDPLRHRPAPDAARRLRRQDKHRDRTNIQAHYDLGNDFFEHFLDPTMMYSAAVFRRDAPRGRLQEKLNASAACSTARANGREIGTGGVASPCTRPPSRRARHHHHHLAEQHAYAVERVARGTLRPHHRAHDDYRDHRHLRQLASIDDRGRRLA
jgi:cyclopropane-fatty-acyl-phospholipid synthase